MLPTLSSTPCPGLLGMKYFFKIELVPKLTVVQI
ncbi:unnamed protein product [Ceutorhynchus assimilis]|uniref:Uncharacterized protein n=1 Tax=Ceutorhynchus assimilis TaxID=467358 RepID=A0A9N9MUC4_9CUCU|nr:unnamed protein product [Ceutorhynchus assimilis]